MAQSGCLNTPPPGLPTLSPSEPAGFLLRPLIPTVHGLNGLLAWRVSQGAPLGAAAQRAVWPPASMP